MTLEIRTAGEGETRAVARRLAGLVRPGDVVLLAGDLGAGKTVFASGLAEGLGVQEPVTSPTFVLVRRYDGFIPVIHADVYRLRSRAEIEDLDLFEEARDGVLVVEWGQAITDAMPPDHLLVELEVNDGQDRLLRLVPRGSWRDRPLEELAS